MEISTGEGICTEVWEKVWEGEISVVKFSLFTKGFSFVEFLNWGGKGKEMEVMD